MPNSTKGRVLIRLFGDFGGGVWSCCHFAGPAFVRPPPPPSPQFSLALSLGAHVLSDRAWVLGGGAASKLDDAMDELESERKTKMEISSDLTRQFKTMQSQLVSKIIDLQVRGVRGG